MLLPQNLQRLDIPACTRDQCAPHDHFRQRRASRHCGRVYQSERRDLSIPRWISLLAYRALSFILNGGSYFPLSALHQFLTIGNPVVNPTDIAESRFRHDSDSEIDNSCGQLSHDVNSKPTKLTPRQRDVLDHIRLGESNKMIARCLGVTEGTVKVHIRQMMRKFHASDRTQLVLDELDVQCASGSRRGQLEHVPPQLNRGILTRRRMGELSALICLWGLGDAEGLFRGHASASDCGSRKRSFAARGRGGVCGRCQHGDYLGQVLFGRLAAACPSRGAEASRRWRSMRTFCWI